MYKLNTITAAILLSASSVSFAYSTGDIIVRTGIVSVNPDSKSDNISAQDSTVFASVSPNSSQVSADNNSQLGLSATYMLNERLGLEVLAATPFSHDLEGEGDLAGADIGSVKHLPPTVSLQYYFLDSASPVQAYVGLGLNYTTFFSEETGSTVEALGYTKLSLDDSFGLTGQVGLDYKLNEHWGVNASIMYAQISTEATLENGAAGDLSVDYDLDPLVYRLNATYTF